MITRRTGCAPIRVCAGRTSRTNDSFCEYLFLFAVNMAIMEAPKAIEETKLWQAFHALFFLIGGYTFIFGTAAYYFPDWEASYLVAGILYTIGSSGFLGVDLMEFFTFTSDPILRINISLSAIGSAFYVIGSVGFIPAVYESTAMWNVIGFTPATTGVYGFIAGSFFIGVSQFWKVWRIMNTTKDMTAVGVELGAGLGAWCFFVGTIMYTIPYYYDNLYVTIVNIWELGSILFTTGAMFLTYRHCVLNVV